MRLGRGVGRTGQGEGCSGSWEDWGADVAPKEHDDSHPETNQFPLQPGTHLALQDCPEQEFLDVLYIGITCRDS